MNRKMKNVQAPSIASELERTKKETLAGVQKLYNLNLDIIEIYKIVSSLDYMITTMNDVDLSQLPEIAVNQIDHQIKTVKDLIEKIDKQVAYDSQNGLLWEGVFPK